MFKVKRPIGRFQSLTTLTTVVTVVTACGGGIDAADTEYSNATEQHAGTASQSVMLENQESAIPGGETYLAAMMTMSPSIAWGSYQAPFSADSIWNSRPVNPVFSNFVIPTSSYFPSVSEGAWSTGAFQSKSTDKPMTVYGYAGSKGLWNADSESYQNVTVPRWPVDVVPASGSDGHADLVDPISGIVHSFFKLKYIDGKWVASQYTWTKLKGRGWGDSAHYFQGSRATGVASIAGIIRKHEVNNGDSMYRHALAMSLTFNALSPNPAYTFPATSADSNAATTNTGAIPQGALMMLPASFNTAEILNPDLRKVAETLKVYGAYVVDRNYGTPFVIYVENGAGFNLHKNGWDGRVGTDLHKIRQALRQVVGASQWVDGNGQAIALNKNLNIMSMRGTWRVQEGSTQGVYDSWAQSISFPSRSVRTVQYSTSSRNLHPVSWALPAAGTSYQLTARTTGGAKLRFQIMDKALGTTVYDSGELQNGQITNFTWPVANYSFRIYAISGVGQPSTVRGELIKTPT